MKRKIAIFMASVMALTSVPFAAMSVNGAAADRSVLTLRTPLGSGFYRDTRGWYTDRTDSDAGFRGSLIHSFNDYNTPVLNGFNNRNNNNDRPAALHDALVEFTGNNTTQNNAGYMAWFEYNPTGGGVNDANQRRRIFNEARTAPIIRVTLNHDLHTGGPDWKTFAVQLTNMQWMFAEFARGHGGGTWETGNVFSSFNNAAPSAGNGPVARPDEAQRYGNSSQFPIAYPSDLAIAPAANPRASVWQQAVNGGAVSDFVGITNMHSSLWRKLFYPSGIDGAATFNRLPEAGDREPVIAAITALIVAAFESEMTSTLLGAATTGYGNATLQQGDIDTIVGVIYDKVLADMREGDAVLQLLESNITGGDETTIKAALDAWVVAANVVYDGGDLTSVENQEVVAGLKAALISTSGASPGYPLANAAVTAALSDTNLFPGGIQYPASDVITSWNSLFAEGNEQYLNFNTETNAGNPIARSLPYEIEVDYHNNTLAYVTFYVPAGGYKAGDYIDIPLVGHSVSGGAISAKVVNTTGMFSGHHADVTTQTIENVKISAPTVPGTINVTTGTLEAGRYPAGRVAPLNTVRMAEVGFANLITYTGADAIAGTTVSKAVIIELEKAGNATTAGYEFCKPDGSPLTINDPNGLTLEAFGFTIVPGSIRVNYAAANGNADHNNAANRGRIRVDFQITIPSNTSNLAWLRINTTLATGIYVTPNHLKRLADIEAFGIENTDKHNLGGDLNEPQNVFVRKLDPGNNPTGGSGMAGTLTPAGTNAHITAPIPAFTFTNTGFKIESLAYAAVDAADAGIVSQPATRAIRFSEPFAAAGSGSLVTRWDMPEVVKFTLVDEWDQPLVDANGEPLVKLFAFGMLNNATWDDSTYGRFGTVNVNQGTHIGNSNRISGSLEGALHAAGNGPLANTRGGNPYSNGAGVWLINNKDNAIRNELGATDFYFTEDGQSVVFSGLNRANVTGVTQVDFFFTLSISPNFKDKEVYIMVEGSGLGEEAGKSYKLSDVRRRVEVDVDNTSRINITQSTEARVSKVTITENRRNALATQPNPYVLDIVHSTNNALTNNTRTASDYFRFVNSSEGTGLTLTIERADGGTNANVLGQTTTQLIAHVYYDTGIYEGGVLTDGVLRVNNSIDLVITRGSSVWYTPPGGQNADFGFAAKLIISGFHVILDRFVPEGNYYISLGTNDNYGRYNPYGDNRPGNYDAALYDRVTNPDSITGTDELKRAGQANNSSVDFINNNVSNLERLLTSKKGYMWYRFYDWGFNSNDFFIAVQNPVSFQPGLKSSIMFRQETVDGRSVPTAIVDGFSRDFAVLNTDGTTDLTPIYYQFGTHYVPLQALANMFGLMLGTEIIGGGKFEYRDSETGNMRWYDVVVVYTGDRKVTFFYDQPFYLIDDREHPMTKDTAGNSRTVNYGFEFNTPWRTYLPLGDFMNALGITYFYVGHPLHPATNDPASPYAGQVIINPPQWMYNQ